MECAKCGGRISDLANAIEVTDQEGSADGLIHVECCDDPAELSHLQFQKWATWMLRSLIHEAYGHRWAVLGLVDAMDECPASTILADLSSISFAGSPPWQAQRWRRPRQSRRVAVLRQSGSWGRRIPG